MLKLLGSGSFGKVVLAKHVNNNVQVAIKVVDKATTEESFSTHNSSFQEISIMEQVSAANSANCINLIESFEDEENWYIVSNLMNVGSLFNYWKNLKTQPLSEEHASEIISQIATGIQSLHSQNIIHRDIKIDNILVNTKQGESTFYVADYGSAAKLESRDEKCKYMIGTRGYVAPEILTGKAYDMSCDIWSLGCIMHALLTARLPFQDSDMSKMDKRVVRESFDCSSLENMSDEAKSLLNGMLAKNSCDRPSIEQVLAHNWLN